MVQINSIRKVDHVGRTTLPPLVMELLHIEKGLDHVYWSIEDGKVVLRKVTRMYYGLDPEYDDIEASLRRYEHGSLDIGEEQDTEGMSPEEIRRLATDTYLKDRAIREHRIAIRKKRVGSRHKSKGHDDPFIAAKESYRRATAVEDS
ncbi:MAG: hypothetical protein E7Z65_01565 [Thermoplasmata archaeon]|jgi:bifunctional DNA-binding transcriptional regulator/antitoxin component of YhaV-PrlF toxin-antitoxin module|nr:hypothetical protein [Thermoplasmata archaeon]